MKKIISSFVLVFLITFCLGQSNESFADSSDQKNKPANTDTASSSNQSGTDTTFHSGITFLNAFNFDFSNKFSTTYLGLFNIFAPHGFKGDSTKYINRRFGYNTGLERISYNNSSINGNDSSQSEFFHQNILYDPLDLYRSPNGLSDTLRAGTPYHRQLNKYTFSSSNVVFSYYFQFLWNTKMVNDPSDRKIGLYAHMHFEFLVNQYTRTANIENIAQDSQTVAINQTHQTSGFNYSRPDRIVSNFNFVSQYFGIGMTAYLKPFSKAKNTHLFGQLTFGAASNTPNFTNLMSATATPALNGTYPNVQTYYSTWKAFYLVKVAFIEGITNNSDLVLGFNLRGLFKPNIYPQYAAYIGINLGLRPILNAISGSNNSSNE